MKKILLIGRRGLHPGGIRTYLFFADSETTGTAGGGYPSALASSIGQSEQLARSFKKREFN